VNIGGHSRAKRRADTIRADDTLGPDTANFQLNVASGINCLRISDRFDDCAVFVREDENGTGF